VHLEWRVRSPDPPFFYPSVLKIGATNPAGCSGRTGAPLLADERGLPRPVDGDLDGVHRCEVGAVEREIWMQFPPLIQR
jgi:hypothetical protein